MALSFDEYQFLKLIQRSPVEADGYAPVSKVVAPLFDRFKLPELVDFQPSENGGKARLTEKGETVMRYAPCPA
jgi:hypothetical protein